MKKRLKEALSKSLTTKDLVRVHNSYDIVGDVVIIRVNGMVKNHTQSIADQVMKYIAT